LVDVGRFFICFARDGYLSRFPRVLQVAH